MKADVKEKWLEGLESGRYNQARFNLKTKDGMCCLGVLCDVMGQPWGPALWEENVASDEDDVPMKGLKNFKGEYITLPDELIREYALTNEQVLDLQKLNDGTDDFTPTIAYIKEKL